MADATGSPQPSAPAPQPSSEVESGKVLAALCYVPYIGLVVSIICLVQKNNAFTLFHAKQALTLYIAVLLSFVIVCLVPLWLILQAVFLVFWVLGLVNAIQGKYAPLPVIGQFADKLFGSIQVEKK